MKRIVFLFCIAALVSVLGVACGDVDELGQGRGNKDDYYWSGSEKIWLDIDYSTMILGFDDEESAAAFVGSMPKEASLFRETTIWVNISNEDVKRKVLADKTIANKIYGHFYSGYDTLIPIRMTGEIIMQPIEGVLPQDVLNRFEVDGEIVIESITGMIVVKLSDWNKIFSTANAIHESGMVDWCHPNFWTLLDRWK